MTEKLYYLDSHMFDFDAHVISCAESPSKKGLYEVILDKTAFFPEGGGQKADPGTIGKANVIDVQEINGEIIHYTDAPVSGNIRGILDKEIRLNKMQNHSGEHIISGLVHNRFGYENSGFHMNSGFITVDFTGEIPDSAIKEIELEANKIIRENIAIITYFPTSEELAKLEYRSKKDLSGQIRIVEIKGVDKCACCAPHVKLTGEIGIIKIFTWTKHRGGMRLEMACGLDALKNFCLRQNNAQEISNMLSAPRDEISTAVKHLIEERDNLKYRLTGLELQLAASMAEKYKSTDNNIVLFENFSEDGARELVNKLTEKTNRLVAVFFNETNGTHRYIIGSKSIDLRSKAKEINEAITGRGGGKPEMIMGSASASREIILNYFK